jgi:hypothetical protein
MNSPLNVHFVLFSWFFSLSSLCSLVLVIDAREKLSKMGGTKRRGTLQSIDSRGKG